MSRETLFLWRVFYSCLPVYLKGLRLPHSCRSNSCLEPTIGLRCVLLHYVFTIKNKLSVTCSQCPLMEGVPAEKIKQHVVRLLVAGNRNFRSFPVVKDTTAGSQLEKHSSEHLWPVQSNVHFGATLIRGTYLLHALERAVIISSQELKGQQINFPIFRSKSDHNSGSQSSLPKDAKKRREGVLECSSSTRLERGRKEGMQEGFSMPQSYKKRKDGVQEGVAQPDLMGSSTSLIPRSMDG